LILSFFPGGDFFAGGESTQTVCQMTQRWVVLRSSDAQAEKDSNARRRWLRAALSGPENRESWSSFDKAPEAEQIRRSLHLEIHESIRARWPVYLGPGVA
jgi:hypothetical protein